MIVGGLRVEQRPSRSSSVRHPVQRWIVKLRDTNCSSLVDNIPHVVIAAITFPVGLVRGYKLALLTSERLSYDNSITDRDVESR
jgi:uncharacterized protein (DUF934 family)